MITPIKNRVKLLIVGLALSLCCGAARADVVAVVSARSPVTALSKNQVADVFLGKMALWANGEKAVPIDQPEGSVARDEFYARFAGKSAAQLKAHWSKIIFTGRGQPPMAVSDGAEVKNQVAEKINAIGYIERDQVDSRLRVLQLQ